MVKRIIGILLMIVLCVFGYFVFNPILIMRLDNKNTMTSGIDSLEIGDTVKIFEPYDFNEGDWDAYISISNSDNMNIANAISKGRLLRTDDATLLNRMKQALYFIYTQSDAATVENEFILCKDGEVVFESGIAIDKIQQGLQDNTYGFLDSRPTDSMIAFCSRFKRVYRPFVILR